MILTRYNLIKGGGTGSFFIILDSQAAGQHATTTLSLIVHVVVSVMNYHKTKRGTGTYLWNVKCNIFDHRTAANIESLEFHFKHGRSWAYQKAWTQLNTDELVAEEESLAVSYTHLTLPTKRIV